MGARPEGDNGTLRRTNSVGPLPITVMHSLSAPSGTTKFVVQLAEGAPPELNLKYFSWREALAGDFDVFHVHWPEFLVRGRTFAGRLRQRVYFLRLLRRIRKRGIPLVRTLHNVEPHESGGRIERWLLNRIDERTDLYVRLNPTSVAPNDRAITTILHGHYRDRFAAHSRSEAVPGRILNFGLIRPYKGIENLLSLFSQWQRPDVSLRVVGKPLDSELAGLVADAAIQDSRVSHELRFVDDNELVWEVTSAQVVVLPYAEMHNSGTLLVALSLGVPVIAPTSASNRAIADEVGPGWLFLYAGSITAEFISDALETISARRDPSQAPSLDGRDWAHIGRRHYEEYARLLEPTQEAPQ